MSRRLSDDEKRFFTDQISLLKNENERLTDIVEDYEAEIAGMRDKWTPPDEVAELQAENAALERENDALMEGIRDVREHIPPTMGAYDMLLALLHPNALLTGESDG